uniref:K+ potassium transporter integral membrane domain-containing protein n=1 Tax=Nelumbo nucifera TaxID=4432 RepID=A0A822XWS7_NELNU|nr:TPA_asm: hypothetical protein HUJ06_025666 [Nelumbo nucifera]
MFACVMVTASLHFITLFVLVFGSFVLLYFSSVLYKFDKGGYLPLSFAGGLFFVMYSSWCWASLHRTDSWNSSYIFSLPHQPSSHTLCISFCLC